jgi:hypothetical protein
MASPLRCLEDWDDALIRGMGLLVVDHPVLGRLDSDQLRLLTEVSRMIELDAGASRTISPRAELMIVLSGSVVVGDGTLTRLRRGDVYGGPFTDAYSPVRVRCRHRAELALVPAGLIRGMAERDALLRQAVAPTTQPAIAAVHGG